MTTPTQVDSALPGRGSTQGQGAAFRVPNVSLIAGSFSKFGGLKCEHADTGSAENHGELVGRRLQCPRGDRRDRISLGPRTGRWVLGSSSPCHG